MNEAERRARWLTLIREELPRAVPAHPDWPISRDHCFARVVLDTVCDRPWRDVIPAPAWRRMDLDQLDRAIALAEAIRDGHVDLSTLNARSLVLRGKASLVQ